MNNPITHEENEEALDQSIRTEMKKALLAAVQKGPEVGALAKIVKLYQGLVNLELKAKALALKERELDLKEEKMRKADEVKNEPAQFASTVLPFQPEPKKRNGPTSLPAIAEAPGTHAVADSNLNCVLKREPHTACI